MSRNSDRQIIGADCIFYMIGTRFPESPIPSRVLIAIGPGAPPRGQLQGGDAAWAIVMSRIAHLAKAPDIGAGARIPRSGCAEAKDSVKNNYAACSPLPRLRGRGSSLRRRATIEAISRKSLRRGRRAAASRFRSRRGSRIAPQRVAQAIEAQDGPLPEPDHQFQLAADRLHVGAQGG